MEHLTESDGAHDAGLFASAFLSHDALGADSAKRAARLPPDTIPALENGAHYAVRVRALATGGISDLSLGAWRGLCAPKATPPAVLAVLSAAVAKAVQEPAYRDTLDKLNLGAAYADAATFRSAMDRDSLAFKALASRLEIKS